MEAGSCGDGDRRELRWPGGVLSISSCSRRDSTSPAPCWSPLRAAQCLGAPRKGAGGDRGQTLSEGMLLPTILWESNPQTPPFSHLPGSRHT